MSSFNQGVPGPATLINSSNCIVLGNTTSGTALTVQQLGAGAVMNVATSTGSSALFVSSTGQVGVGTATVSAGLQYWGGASSTTTNGAPGSGGVIIGSDATNGSPGDYSPVLHFRQSWYTQGQGSVTTGGIAGYKTVASGSFGGGLAFLYCANGATSLAQGMTLTDTGRVGIGVTNPGYTLTSAGTICGPYSTTPLLACYSQGSGTFTYANVISCAYINYRDSTQIFTPGNGGNGGAPVMTLQHGNLVGIGTTNPAAALDVAGKSKLGALGSVTTNIITGSVQLSGVSSTVSSIVINIGQTLAGTSYYVFCSLYTGASATYTFSITTGSLTTTQFTFNVILQSGAGSTPTLKWVLFDLN